MKKKRIILAAAALSAALLVSALAVTRSSFKMLCVEKYENDRGQELYLLGTIHGSHFSKIYDYSMEDIAAFIKNTDPDYVLIEAREETFEKYGVIDGPVDMIFAYSCCVQNGIPVGMIDWWVIENGARPNTTNDNRDDMMHDNIMRKLEGYEDGCRVLIIVGRGHLSPQAKRLESSGCSRVKTENKKALFSGDGAFSYPPLMEETIENKIRYYDSVERENISALTDDKTRDAFLSQIDQLIVNLTKQKELVKENRLYY